MSEPRDPDTEDKRNDRDRPYEPDRDDRHEADGDIDEVVFSFDIFDRDTEDNDTSLIDFDRDDLHEMEGPDA